MSLECEDIYNVISLEFSYMKLEDLVEFFKMVSIEIFFFYL